MGGRRVPHRLLHLARDFGVQETRGGAAGFTRLDLTLTQIGWRRETVMC